MGLRCFVAIAFDREDTDKIYNRTIRSVLRQKKITPIRIDRVEHNDDIDDRIIAELQKCDFCIADLTYARPSVYFEAGFAQRHVSVIYTCRQDHFKTKPDDEFGNFRVHFDLQMKNIVPWRNPSDARFATRLARRIISVTKPIIQKQAIQARTRADLKRFSSLSTKQKLTSIMKIANTLTRQNGYRVRDVSDHPFAANWLALHYSLPPYAAKRLVMIQALKPGCIGIKKKGNTIHAAVIYITPNASKSYFLHLQEATLEYPCYSINLPDERSRITSMVEHIFVCSLRKVSVSNVMHWIPELEFDRQTESLSMQTSEQLLKQSIRGKEVYRLTPKKYFVVRPGVKDLDRVREVSLTAAASLPKAAIVEVDGGRDTERKIYLHLVDGFQSEKEFALQFGPSIGIS